MKKLSLLLASTMLATVSAFAQTKPAAPAYTSFDEAFASDDAYYLYNVEAGLFLTKGNDWGTRASVASNGSTIVSYDDLLLGKAEVTGVPWYIGEATTINDTECYYFENKSGNGGVYNTVDNLDGIWVDGGSDRPWNRWFINKLEGNTFQLSYFIEQTEGEGEDAVTSFVKPAGWYGAQRLFTDGDTRTYIEEGANTTWAVVSASEFEKIQPKLNLYYVQLGLADLITKAKAQGSTSIAEYEALVNDANADRDEVIAAINVIAPAVLLGEAINAAKEVDPSYNYSKFEALFNNTEATAAELNDATTLLKAITALKKALNEAQAKYPALDYSEPTAVYNNLDATLEEVNAAKAQVSEIVSKYEQSQATLENPADITAAIQYVADDLDGTAFAAWTTTTTSGSFQLNTWSTEGNPGNDGTNMVTPFIEYWKSAGNLLDSGKYYRDQEKKPFSVLPGAYRISANIRLYNESGADYMTGAYIFGNANRTNLVQAGVSGPENAIEGAVYGEFNGMLYYWKDSFETYTIVTEDGKLQFGLQTEDVNFNWAASKGWKVEYLGDAYDALDHVRKNSELAVPETNEETIATKQLLADYNTAKATYETATSADAIISAYATLVPLAEDLPANIAAWKAYDDKVWEAKNHSILENGAGEYVDLLEAYVGNDAEEPNGYNSFPNGSYQYIIDAMSLSTEEVVAETKYITQLLEDAVKKSMQPGQDVSEMLVNPKFKDGFTGWTYSAGTAGGLKAYPCVERYGGSVDVYQVVEDVPDGIYSLTCKAFERPADIGGFDENTPTVVSLYMNDFQTPVKNIAADGLPVDQAINYENSFFDGGVGEDYYDTAGTTNHDSEFTTLNGETLYVPNGMSGASYAFRAGRYEQKVYGLVEGGTMKIGLTSNGVDAHWVLWADFTLTYEGKSEEALDNVIESTLEKADLYMTENEDNLTAPALDALDVAISDAIDAQDSGDVDVMWNALIALNKALSDARTNVATVADLKKALETMEDALNNAEAPSTAAMDAYDAVNEKVADEAYMELTTEELKELIEEANLAAAMLKIPAYEEASDENPIDMTSVIINADFSQNSGTNIPGWTLESKGIQNATTKGSGINGQSTECWNPNVSADYWFKLSQTLTALPEGTYELTARAFNAQPDNNGADGNVAFYATTSGGTNYSTKVEVTPSGSDDEIMAGAGTYSIIFNIKEGESVTIGFQSIGKLPAHWFMCDDFTLSYFGNASAKEANGDDGRVVIEGVESDAAAVSAIYTITGAKVSSLQKGINIVKYANGKVAKVLVK